MVRRQEFRRILLWLISGPARYRRSSVVTEENQAVKLNIFELDISQMQIRWYYVRLGWGRGMSGFLSQSGHPTPRLIFFLSFSTRMTCELRRDLFQSLCSLFTVIGIIRLLRRS